MTSPGLQRAILFHPGEIEPAAGGRLEAGRPGRGFGGVSIDSRTLRPGELFVAIRGGRFDGHDFAAAAIHAGAGGLIVERWPLGLNGASGGELPVWQVPDTTVALGALARFHRRRFLIPVAALTGSCGKTTTKEMIAHLLTGFGEVCATAGTRNNRIGLPLTLLGLSGRHRTAVVELGADRPGEIGMLTAIADPTVGLITNIGPAHLERFGSLAGVLKAKGEMWERIGADRPVILCADDPLLREAGEGLSRRVVWFGIDQPADIQAGGVTFEPWGTRCRINGKWQLSLPVPGRHNLLNALAALAVARALGFPMEKGIERLASVTPPPGRLVRREKNGILFLDDTYNANPASFRAALEVLKGLEVSGRRVLAAGEMRELGPESDRWHRQVGEWARAAGVDFLVTVGELTEPMAQGAAPAPVRRFETVEAAAPFLAGELKAGDAVLVKGSRAVGMERLL